MKKDYFSGHSKLYATFRPSYPEALYKFLFQNLQSFEAAWDCGTGNGQVAKILAGKFQKVYATDISSQQLENAHKADNILYTVASAEKSELNTRSIDLITVAQAFHWFDAEAFYNEVKRVAKPGAILAIWGYNVLKISPEVDDIITDFYLNTTGPYWDERRKLIDLEYTSIPFPFEELTFPKIDMEMEWSLEHLTGYLTTWSATQKFIKINGFDPVVEVREKLKPFWSSGEIKKARFPLFGKIGSV
jgi:SAM-dependent methyltransferase